MIAQYGQGANDGNRDGGVVRNTDGFQMRNAIDGRGCRYAVLNEGNAV